MKWEEYSIVCPGKRARPYQYPRPSQIDCASLPGDREGTCTKYNCMPWHFVKPRPMFCDECKHLNPTEAKQMTKEHHSCSKHTLRIKHNGQHPRLPVPFAIGYCEDWER